ncbi:2-oxo-4-hydroxy-4-carboxy-5-ureidoimidazoline decarboxylase [Eoetvoesiella caeni]|uniref:2-oxo-4-hydroxy-4-carboxy-5-ureidoimidazoline decarboxylase n=1 Tax=Eoetvoesiella caeni TaxID=645616 RepID=A0A366HEZ6_9BURK|nr:2-oxo-4-hydroxy-4-carboxy-5-ureidoimidazoline decarboxylase [Eoetvoesiella caeni]MCI2808401.1 2-oxo-4-hydroxy-4-carboxy-5-ureidoimidazoline decarboxylase [Eoetvoesiella caeni]NYT54942.1 2-oxo-4-hydroxy-4-carboxy-5-ureidoimidazoline decarboxylase [Eoetvoesiella caeni]RBP41085.1 2-oxo-4-hydroxy-4-carboxy-5-ureidoimidazoline decarboxylase [Eoetvoesiella caeni]
MSETISMNELNNLSAEDFVRVLGGIFEHSPWVAQGVEKQRPFAGVADLHQAMIQCIEQAGQDAQLRLILAHPELAGKAAVRGELTAESSSEQAGAGLDNCSAEEFATLTALNQAYREKFGFPFILAVRGYDRAGIIEQFQRRLGLAPEAEMAESLAQIYKIGRLRLDGLIPG